MKHYYLDLFGCAKNQVDAENMMSHLDKAGWERACDAELSDLIIVNSCGFIESAKRESIDAVLEWRKFYPEKKILLAGCLARRYAEELPGLLTEADIFACNTDEVVKKASDVFQLRSKLSSFSLPGERPLLSLPGSAYVKISEGCDNSCSYCAIPLIRGGLVSRTIPDILDECRALLKRGINELCLVGQDIGSFGCEKGAAKLPELLNAISALDGNFWVRLLYIHPNHFPVQILDLIEKDSRFLPYFDIPFQHASAGILALMNRHAAEYPAREYLELIGTIRGRLPYSVIRSTFLIGFPGETEEDFSALLDFHEKANLDWLGCFTYSREEGTESYSMKGRVPAKKAVMRKKIIEERQIPISEKNMERFTGRNMDVLIEEKIARDKSGGEPPAKLSPAADEIFWLGRTYCQAPEIDGATVIVCKPDNKTENIKPGEFIRCKIIARRGFDLEAKAL